MKEILIPISVGELIDKITILQLKIAHIQNQEKVENVKRELEMLIECCKKNEIEITGDLFGRLKKCNEELWKIEDDIREKERKKEFDAIFIELARKVYITNDLRCKLKKEINQQTGSLLVEEKSYADY